MSELERLLYPKKEAAHALGVSIRTIDYLLAKRAIEFKKIGRRVLIPVAELKRIARAAYTATGTATNLAANAA